MDAETVTVNGDNTYSTPTGYTLPTSGTVAGTYTWSAKYTSARPKQQRRQRPGRQRRADRSQPSHSDAGHNRQPSLRQPGRQHYPDPERLRSALGRVTIQLARSRLPYPGRPGPWTRRRTTVNGNGTYTTPTGYTLPTSGTVAGTYTWSAKYTSADQNNNDASDQGGSDEQTVVSPATPTLVTTASPASVNLDGSTTPTLSDSAVLSGGYFETGSITFTLSGPGGFSYSQTDQVSDDVTYNASTSLPATGTVAGTYTWSAKYTSADQNNNDASDQGGSEEQTVALANAQIVATPMSFASDGGVDYGYQITGGDLPATTVDLYWARGTTTDTEIPGPIATTTTDTVQGTYPLEESRSDLGVPQEGAKYILEVVDPSGDLPASENPDGVKYIQLPELDVTSFDLHPDTADTWARNQSTAGGVKFTFQIAGADLPAPVPIALFWASGTTIDTVDTTKSGARHSTTTAQP